MIVTRIRFILVKSNMFSFLTRNYLLWSFLALAFVTRTIWLGNIPGINGDEAWYGIMARCGFDLSMRTPTGNFPNVFYLVPQIILHKIFPPSFILLRAVSLLSGLALVVVGSWMIGRKHGRRAALYFTMLCAGMPVLVAYSRFGWDVSQTGLAAVFLVLFSLSKNWVSAAVMLAVAFIIHPSNLFLVFIPVNLAVVEFRSQHESLVTKRVAVSHVARALLFLLLVLCVALFKMHWLSYIVSLLGMDQALSTARQMLQGGIVDRILSLEGWIKLAVLFGDLISGVTMYRYLAGPISDLSAAIHSALFWLLIIPTIVCGVRVSTRRGDYQLMALLIGVFLGLVMMYVLFGTYPISPHYERYSQFLVIPAVVLFVLCLMELRPRVSTPLCMFVAVFWLVSLTMHYFLPFHSTGGLSHQAFRTAKIEPKQQVIDYIIANTGEGSRPAVIGENWWLVMPIRYLVGDLEGEIVAQSHYVRPKEQIATAMSEGNVYLVSFSDSAWNALIAQNDYADTLTKKIIYDYGDNPLIHVWHRAK